MRRPRETLHVFEGWKTLIVRVSDPGEVLGLPATVTGTPYELTADVIEPAQASFISRTDFLNFLRGHGEVSLHVAQQLGETNMLLSLKCGPSGYGLPPEKNWRVFCSTGALRTEKETQNFKPR